MHFPENHVRFTCRCLRWKIAVALWALLPVASFAQTSHETASPVSSEVVTIPEFQVSESRQRDEWFASQAMSGTRAASSILELPFQVQVLTREFLEDFHLIALSEQMSFLPGYSGAADQADAVSGSFSGGRTLRGFDQTIVRDGFRSTPPPTVGNTAQVEVIKGPISTLYGDASPGGLINYISKRPSTRPTYNLSLSGGSYDYFRSNLTASGPLYKNRIFYLFNAENYYRKGELNYTYARNGDYVIGVLFKPTASTSLNVNYEIVRLVGARAATIPSLVLNPTATTTRPGLSWSGGIVAGIDWRLARARYSRFGPNEHYKRNYDGLNILLEHAYNANWKHRIAYQGQWKSFNQFYRTSSNVSSVTNRMNDVRPNRRVQDIDSPGAYQTDLLGHVTTGPIKHTLLFTADYAKLETRDLQLRLDNQQVRDLLPDSYRYPDPFNQDWSLLLDYSVLRTIGSKNYEDVTSRGGSVSDRVALAEGRVLLMGNVRHDKAKFATDSSTTTNVFTRGEAASTTYSVGANLKLRGDSLVAFANHSTSFNTNITVDRNLGTTIPNERGRGWEAGVKSLALDRRLGLTVSVFEIEKNNIGQTNPDFVLGGAMPEYVGSGRERVRGVDGDFSWKLDEQLSLLAGAAYLDARVVDSSNAALRDTRKLLVPRHTGSLAVRYKLGGKLKGVTLGSSFRYTGGFVRANAAATRLYEEGAARQLYGAFVSYSWRQRHWRHTAQLNVNNLFDKFYVGPDTTVGLGRQINFTYTIAFR